MPSRAELELRAGNVGVDPANYPNDSNLEQKTIYEEKLAQTATGIKASGTVTSDATAPDTGGTVTIGSKTYTFRTTLTGVRATAVLTSDATAPSDADTVTLGSTVYTFKTALTEAAATGVLTASDVFSDGEEVVIGDTTYTMKATLSSGPTVPFEVLIGASAAASLDNLKLAINAGAGSGTNYSVGTTAHPDVTATTNTDTAQTVEANETGVAGNAIATTTDAADVAWGAATLENGADTVANEVLIGASAAAALDNLKSAVNATTGEGTEYSNGTDVHPTVRATTNTNTEQTVEAKAIGTSGNSIAKAESSSHLDWDGVGAVLTGGVASVANEVLIGGSAAAALDNLKLAVNATPAATEFSEEYSQGTTANAQAEATTNTNTTQLIVALSAGDAGNSIAFTESATHITVDGSGTLIGGTDSTVTSSKAYQVSGGQNV